MLVLSRKKDEQIIIGKDIVISVVEIQNGRVRLGITAPRDVPILRSELINWKNDGGTTIQEQAEKAAKASAETIDVNLMDINDDTEDTLDDSLSGFILPADVSAVVKATITKPNEGSVESTGQSAKATS